MSTLASQLTAYPTSGDVTIPHFGWPFKLSSTGAHVTQQDSDEEIASCINVVANCFVGQWPELPGFGIPDKTFTTGPPDPDSIVQAILNWEPRASAEGVSSMVNDGTTGTWNITVTQET